MNHIARVYWATRVRRLGWIPVRQAMLKRGATATDLAWVLVTTLQILGAGLPKRDIQPPLHVHFANH